MANWQTQRIVSSDKRALLAVALLSLPVVFLLVLWLGYDEAWIHPEQIRAGVYVWTPPSQDLTHLLRKSFDWAALDTANPIQWRELAPHAVIRSRVRPLSDIALVIDAVVRPYLSQWLYPHPSLTPSAIVAAIISPALFFGFVRLVTASPVTAALLTGLFLSSMGFLSIIIPDIHSGAKRLAVLSLCLALYLAERHHTSNKAGTFGLLAITVFLSLFTDEIALGGYVVLAVLYAPSLVRQGYRWKALVFALMPVIFVATVRWGLPAFYANAGIEGTPTFNAFGDSKKLGILAHVGEWDFYSLALEQTARAMLTTFGILRHSVGAQYAAITILALGSLSIAWRQSENPCAEGRRYELVASALVLLANGFYLTLLDLYPPGGTTYLASYAYYYHCSLSVLALVWLAFFWRGIADFQWKSSTAQKAASWVLLSAYVVVIFANFGSFHTINQLVSLAHSYPYDPPALYKRVREIPKQLGGQAPGTLVEVEIEADCIKTVGRFESIFASTIGDAWGKDEFHRSFLRAFLLAQDLEYLLQAHFPKYKFVVRTTQPGVCDRARRIARTTVKPNHGTAEQSVLVTGSGFTPKTGFYIRWNDQNGPILASDMTDEWGIVPATTVTLPRVPPGRYTIFVTNERDSTATTPFTIDAPRPPSAP